MQERGRKMWGCLLDNRRRARAPRAKRLSAGQVDDNGSPREGRAATERERACRVRGMSPSFARRGEVGGVREHLLCI